MIFLILTIIQSILSPEVMEIIYRHPRPVLLLQAILSYKSLALKKKTKKNPLKFFCKFAYSP